MNLRTLQSHHASMQRLNSICAVGNGSNRLKCYFNFLFPLIHLSIPRQEMVVVYNGNIDTCLLYSGRPANNSNSQVSNIFLNPKDKCTLTTDKCRLARNCWACPRLVTLTLDPLSMAAEISWKTKASGKKFWAVFIFRKFKKTFDKSNFGNDLLFH